MPLKTGGYADKYGSRYDVRWCIYQLLKVIDEKIKYVIIEPVEDIEKGIDLLLRRMMGQEKDSNAKDGMVLKNSGIMKV